MLEVTAFMHKITTIIFQFFCNFSNQHGLSNQNSFLEMILMLTAGRKVATASPLVDDLDCVCWVHLPRPIEPLR